MARRDQLTGKSKLTGNKRSHAMNHSRRTWNLNLQKVKVMLDDGSTQTIKVSARTLKTLKKQGRL